MVRGQITSTEFPSRVRILDAIVGAWGNLSCAALKLGISEAELKRRVDQSPVLTRVLADEKEKPRASKA